jgi:hypothetical protein
METEVPGLPGRSRSGHRRVGQLDRRRSGWHRRCSEPEKGPGSIFASAAVHTPPIVEPGPYGPMVCSRQEVEPGPYGLIGAKPVGRLGRMCAILDRPLPCSASS